MNFEIKENKYLKVAHIVNKLLSRLSTQSTAEIRNIIKNVSTSDANIDFDKFSNSFAKEYWLRNYWKSVYFFEYESLPIAIDLIRQSKIEILVLGAGSASDTIACMVWLSKTLKTNRKISITLVDRSQKQLDLASKLINNIRKEVSNINFNINYKKLEIKDWDLTPNSIDLVLMSHFLTENYQGTNNILEKVRLVVRERAQVVIIERQKDRTWKKAKDTLNNMGIPVLDMKTYKKDLISLLSPLDDEKDDLLTMTPHYVLARLPENKYQIDIVAKFFRSWKGQSTKLLEEIFHKNAKYYEKPMLDKPFTGLNAINEYWEDNPLSQRNIKVKPKKIGYEYGHILCEFGGDFDTPKQHIDISGVLIFDIDSKTRQIKQLREYFNTIKRPFEVVQ